MSADPKATLKFTPAPQYAGARLLPEPLPDSPFPILQSWLEEAEASGFTENANAMTLCTVDPDGRPSARILLCKAIDVPQGRATFFTNRESRKGLALAAHPHAALVFHWDHLSVQARVEGPVTLATDDESDEYWRSRWIISRLGASVSQQSRPVGSRAEMLRKVEDAAKKLGIPLDGSANADIPRPANWGGYHVWADRVELWIGQPGRVHDRAEWRRTLTPTGDGFKAGPWNAMRLQP